MNQLDDAMAALRYLVDDKLKGNKLKSKKLNLGI